MKNSLKYFFIIQIVIFNILIPFIFYNNVIIGIALVIILIIGNSVALSDGLLFKKIEYGTKSIDRDFTKRCSVTYETLYECASPKEYNEEVVIKWESEKKEKWAMYLTISRMDKLELPFIQENSNKKYMVYN